MDDLFSEIFPGLASMPNWHPLLVHFPIALLTCYLLLDVVGAVGRKADWRRQAGSLLYLGTLFAAAAVALGLRAAASVPHGEAVHSILVSHQHHGFAVLGMALLLSLWRRFAPEWWKLPHLLLSTIMVAIMIHGADKGGLMVYGHGVGVQGVVQDHHEHNHDHDADHHH